MTTYNIKSVETMDDIDKIIDKFSEIQKQNCFKSVWSLDYKKITPKDINKKSGYKIKKLTYCTYGWGKDITLNVNLNNPTWLELWSIADKMIAESEDGHHIFIENFKLVNEKTGEYTLVTGS